MSDATPPVPEGWYPDPGEDLQQRWWDGVAWTTYTRLSPDAQIVAPSGPPQGQPADSPVTGGALTATRLSESGMTVEEMLASAASVRKPAAQKSRRNAILIGVVVLIVMALAFGVLAANRRLKTAIDTRAGNTTETGGTATTLPFAGTPPPNGSNPGGQANNGVATQTELRRAGVIATSAMAEAPGTKVDHTVLAAREPALKFGPSGAASATIISVLAEASDELWLAKAVPTGDTFLCVHVTTDGAAGYGQGATEAEAIAACTSPAWTCVDRLTDRSHGPSESRPPLALKPSLSKSALSNSSSGAWKSSFSKALFSASNDGGGSCTPTCSMPPPDSCAATYPSEPPVRGPHHHRRSPGPSWGDSHRSAGCRHPYRRPPDRHRCLPAP